MQLKPLADGINQQNTVCAVWKAKRYIKSLIGYFM